MSAPSLKPEFALGPPPEPAASQAFATVQAPVSAATPIPPRAPAAVPRPSVSTPALEPHRITRKSTRSVAEVDSGDVDIPDDSTTISDDIVMVEDEGGETPRKPRAKGKRPADAGSPTEEEHERNRQRIEDPVRTSRGISEFVLMRSDRGPVANA